MLTKIRNLRIQDKIVIFVYVLGMIFLLSSDIDDLFDDNLAITLSLNVGLILYWIFFGFNKTTTSQASDIESSSSLLGNIKFGFIGTKLVRGIVMFIVLIVVAVLWRVSKEIIPEDFGGGVTRSGIALLILYSVWRKVLPMINIGTQTNKDSTPKPEPIKSEPTKSKKDSSTNPESREPEHEIQCPSCDHIHSSYLIFCPECGE